MQPLAFKASFVLGTGRQHQNVERQCIAFGCRSQNRVGRHVSLTLLTSGTAPLVGPALDVCHEIPKLNRF